MSIINFHTKEISVKVVYYGPGLCGKTTSLQTIYASLPPERRPQIVSLATEVDRTIFFDFLPVTAYRIRDFRVRLQLYTVPGQVFYNATRKLVLNGVDGIVFVADSQAAMKDSNLESLQNLSENLADLGLDPEQVPTVLQFNKRDLKEIYPVEEMDKLYNPRRLPVFATVATNGDGLFEVLRAISQMIVNHLLRKGLGKQLGAPADTGPKALGASDSIGAAAASHMANQPPALAHQSPPVLPVSMAPISMEPPRAAATGHAPPPAASSTSKDEIGLWPAADRAPFGDALERAVADGRWNDAVQAADLYVRHLARVWAMNSGNTVADPLPSFLLMRGLSSNRYRGLLDALTVARNGRPLDRGQAMNALVLVLEALW